MAFVVRNRAERRVAGAVLAALVLGSGAVACSKGGGSEESPQMTPAAAVAAAAKNSAGITALHYSMSGTMPGAGTIRAEARMSMKPLAMTMKMSSSVQKTAEPVEIRYVGSVMYINGGAEAAKELKGKHWLKFDLSGTAAAQQMNSQPAGAGQANQNPAQDSTFLSTSKNVQKVGTETVKGVKTTHYKGEITVGQMREALKNQKLGKAAREQREKSIDQYAALGADKMSMDLWIDGDSHVKQFRMRGDTSKGAMDVTTVFLDYDKPVSVTAPAAGDTVDLAAMMKDAQQG
ncbi:DUF1396 domain-containing protein [Streptomyces sp. NPDC048664]|uniref:DUF1396 domain-containing protein n=1 Tax=Streptomyces sp. NPDC048664 TaxID=3154505 RepID=UPI003413A22B